jgi:hypothetical protein
MPWPIYPLGKSPRYELDRRLCGPHNRSGRCGVETNLVIGSRNRTLQPTADCRLPTELSWIQKKLLVGQLNQSGWNGWDI